MTTTPEFEIDDLTSRRPFPLLWDSTMRGAFVACPRQFFYEFIIGLAPTAHSIHLHFGGAFAAGLEAYRRVFYDPSPTIPADDRHDAALAAGMKAIILEWGDYEPDEKEQHKTFDNCLLALDGYFNHWLPGTDHIQPLRRPDGSPAVEFTFAIPIEEVLHPETGEPLLYSGRLDMIGVHNDMIYGVDEKTTKQLGPSWARQWTMRAQFLGYSYALQYFGYQVAGAVVRGTCIRTKSQFDFAECILPTQQWKIDAWYQQLIRDLRRAVTAWEKWEWDQDFGHTCAAYSGCPTLRLCDSPHPERWIKNYYVKRTWNPLASDPTSQSPSTEGAI